MLHRLAVSWQLAIESCVGCGMCVAFGKCHDTKIEQLLTGTLGCGWRQGSGIYIMDGLQKTRVCQWERWERWERRPGKGAYEVGSVGSNPRLAGPSNPCQGKVFKGLDGWELRRGWEKAKVGSFSGSD